MRYLLDSVVYLPAILLAHAFSHNDRTSCVLITMRLCHSRSLAAGIDECNIREQIYGGREEESWISSNPASYPLSSYAFRVST